MSGDERGHVRCSLDSGILTVTIDRPSHRNAMTWPMYARAARGLRARRD
jgi:enoyl-CoA hydratase/carnithine racemase